MRTPHAVDNTDWLKTAAIILVVVDHIGYFFIEDADWWSVFGRLAAPPFFFLLGYAQTRTVPLHWIWLGVILTLLESWNAGWTWVAPNILLSLALIRIARPYVQVFVQHHGWTAFALIVSALFAVMPIAAKIVDYGAEGWLWALFGFCQRMYVEGRSNTDEDGAAQSSPPPAASEDRERGPHAPAGLPCCCGRLRLAGTKESSRFLRSNSPSSFSASASYPFSLCLFLRGPEPLATAKNS